MATFLTSRRLLGFRDFFPNEIPKPKEYYANRLGKDLLQKAVPFFLSYTRAGGMPEVDIFLKDVFTYYDHTHLNSPSYVMMVTEYRRIKNHHPGELHSVLAVESFLNMFLWVMQDKNIPEKIDKGDVSQMLTFFELILLFNDDVLVNYERATSSIQSYGEDRKLQRLILSGSFPQSDLENIDYAQILYGQVYKLAKLLTFLEQTEKYHQLLERLLEEFSCKSTEEYLKAICAAAISPFASEAPTWNVLSLKNATDKEKGAHILDLLSLSDTEIGTVDQNDYLQLRNTPFQKLAKEEYRVVFELFLLKKIYNGLIFKLSSYDKNFLGNIRIDFSEGVLAYDILASILDRPEALRVTGDDFKMSGLEREPDYYCRRGEDILLFESKDFYMRGEYKLSYDFAIIERELMKEGRLKKAVTQLVKNIERVLLKELPLDKEYDVTSVAIHPVILVHDALYSAPGMNYWVYYWFIDELNQLKAVEGFESIDFSNVWPITIIEIDSLMLYENQFQEGHWELTEIIKDYQLFVDFQKSVFQSAQEVERHARGSAVSFSEFLRTKAHHNGVEIDMRNVHELLERFGVS